MGGNFCELVGVDFNFVGWGFEWMCFRIVLEVVIGDEVVVWVFVFVDVYLF